MSESVKNNLSQNSPEGQAAVDANHSPENLLTAVKSVEKDDIRVPKIKAGDSAIVLQRHEKYIRDKSSEQAGSICEEVIADARSRACSFFRDLLSDDDAGETMVLFVASDTKYGNGYRAMETAQIAQEAAVGVMQELKINPSDRIINFNPQFSTNSFDESSLAVRPNKKVVEPKIFDQSPEYIDHLLAKYGDFQKAMAAHEQDAEQETRQEFGAEGVDDVIDRVKSSLSNLKRYAEVFHTYNADKRLLVWVATHYDTISPLVKDSCGMDPSDYLPVDYGGGIVIELSKDHEPRLKVQEQDIPLAI